MKVRVTLITCGTCGRPRGLRHVCRTSALSTRKKRRTAIRPRLAVTCGRCGKPRGVSHTCVTRTDFAKRRRQAEAQRKKRAAAEKRRAKRAAAAQRKKEAAARRRAAAKARKAAAKTAPRRPRSPAHDYLTCTDPECTRYGCEAYRRGTEDCPLPHQG